MDGHDLEIARFNGQANIAYVDGVVLKSGDGHAGVEREKIEPGARMLAMELNEDTGKNFLQDGRRKSNADTGSLTTRRALRNFDGFLGAGERCAGSCEKTFAGFGKLDGSPISIEQAHTDVLLQPLNLRRDGWLRKVKLRGGADEAFLFSDSHKSSQVFQFHAGPPGK